VEEPSLRRLSEKLGCRIVPHHYDVDSLDEYKRLVVLEWRLGDTGNDLPVVVLGNHVLGGTAEITQQLEKLLAGYRETGLPPVEVPTVKDAEAALRAAASASQAGGRPVRLAYFDESGCRQCARAERVLDLAKARFAQLEVRRFNARTDDGRILLEVLCERAGVPASQRHLVPAVFVGTKALIRQDIADAAVDALCSQPANAASPAVWETTPEERAAAAGRLWERARALSLATVVTGGLVDGVNPCAFATLVFFVCCLAGAGTNRRVVLAMGVFFTLGVVIMYFLTGVGLSEGLRRLDVFPSVSRALTWLIIGGTFVLAAVSFWDFLTALRGRARDMKLKLPDRLRMRINAIISRRLHARSVAVGALGLGATVSLLEFVCTGQVYFPLIRYMTAVSDTRLRALGLLVLYCLAFAVPLIAVFVATYFGLRSERLVAALKRHVATAKFLLTAFFLGLGALLLRLELGRSL
jgi:cytochrome c biogenesis protein CcdA